MEGSTIRPNKKLKRELIKLCEKRVISLNELICSILQEYVNKKEEKDV